MEKSIMHNIKCYSQRSEGSFFSLGRYPSTHEGRD